MTSFQGSVPAHALYGSPVSGQRLAALDGARIAAPSGPYVGRGNKCSANEDTCEGMRVKTHEYCAGHLRKYKPDVLKAGVDKTGGSDGV